MPALKVPPEEFCGVDDFKIFSQLHLINPLTE